MTGFFTSEYLTKSEYLTHSLCEMAAEVATHGPTTPVTRLRLPLSPSPTSSAYQFYEEPVSERLSARLFRWLAPQALFKVLL